MKRILIACAFVGFGPLAAVAATVTPQPGYYYDLHYIVSASVSGAGSCVDAVGSYYVSSTYYPGPSKPGFTDWRPVNDASSLGEVVETYPVTQAAGVATWSGSFTIVVQPGGTKSTGTFSTTTSYADAHSSASAGTFTYPVAGGGTCTTKEQSNLIPQGK